MYENNHRSRQLRPKPIFKEYQVDADFAHRIVGKLVATREFCEQALWDYVKKKNLLVGPNKNILVPDEYLIPVLGTGQINVHRGIAKFVKANIFEME